ncbi:MAG: HAD-IA family hydrolase [Clostridia bacterium]|nr:HAD-IA family hydrolase [Clostridia bacterium]
MKYKTFIFDLDGTLLNTLDDLAESVNYAMKQCGFPKRTLDEIRRFVGNGVKKLIERALPEGTDEAEFNKVLGEFKEHYSQNSRNKTAPYEGIMELLHTLKDNGCNLAIVSNKVDFAVKDLRDEFFSDVIDVAIGDSDAIRTKPEPDMVYKAIDELGTDRDSCVYIGDSDVDIITAKNSGMDCISVSWGFRSRFELENCGAKMIADKPEDILKFVKYKRLL